MMMFQVSGSFANYCVFPVVGKKRTEANHMSRDWKLSLLFSKKCLSKKKCEDTLDI